MRPFVKGILFALAFLTTTPAEARIVAKDNYITIGEYKSLIYYNSFLTVVDIGREYSFSRLVSFSGELSAYKFWENDYSSIGLGLRPAMELSFLRKPTHTWFVDVKGGVIVMLPQYPSTAINFTFQCGFGSDINLNKKHKLRIGTRYSHLSNGKVMEQASNPSWDGGGVYVGYLF